MIRPYDETNDWDGPAEELKTGERRHYCATHRWLAEDASHA